MRKLLLIAFAVAVLATAGVGVFTIASEGGVPKRAAKAQQAPPPKAPDDSYQYPKPHPRVAVAVRPGEDPPPGSGSVAQSSASGPDAKRQRAVSDAEVRQELAQFRHYLSRQGPSVGGPVAKVLADGNAVAPRNAPAVVKQVIAAGNAIALTPYLWGGGHGAWDDTGYDCSGSISFALAGAGLLESPLTSTGFMRYGEQGEGRWITIYANDGHAFMVVAGLRFDTSGRSSANQGTRWQAQMRSTDGFAASHPPGL